LQLIYRLLAFLESDIGLRGKRTKGAAAMTTAIAFHQRRTGKADAGPSESAMRAPIFTSSHVEPSLTAPGTNARSVPASK